ncbi:MAG: tripartite tricarboxylate transporter TctB family protein [Pseudomonadota bacterium]
MSPADTTAQSGAWTDIAAGTLMALAALLMVAAIIPAEVSDAAGRNDISPAFVPQVTAYLILGFSALLIVNGIKRRNTPAGRAGQSVGVVARDVVLAAVAVTLFQLAFVHLGFLIAGAAAIAVAMFAIGERRLVLVVPLAGLAPVALQQASWRLLSIWLP